MRLGEIDGLGELRPTDDDVLAEAEAEDGDNASVDHDSDGEREPIESVFSARDMRRLARYFEKASDVSDDKSAASGTTADTGSTIGSLVKPLGGLTKKQYRSIVTDLCAKVGDPQPLASFIDEFDKTKKEGMDTIDFDAFVALYATVKKEATRESAASPVDDKFAAELEQRTLMVTKKTGGAADDATTSSTEGDQDSDLIEAVRAEFETETRKVDVISESKGKVTVVFAEPSAIDEILASTNDIAERDVEPARWYPAGGGKYKIKLLCDRPLMHEVLIPPEVARLREAFDGMDEDKSGDINMKVSSRNFTWPNRNSKRHQPHNGPLL